MGVFQTNEALNSLKSIAAQAVESAGMSQQQQMAAAPGRAGSVPASQPSSLPDSRGTSRAH